MVDIDTIGTFNVSSVLYKKFFRVGILLARAFLPLGYLLITIPYMFQDHGGVIVNITATLSMRGQVLQLHAGAAKAAVGMCVPCALLRLSPEADNLHMNLILAVDTVELTLILGLPQSGTASQFPLPYAFLMQML